MKMESCVKQDQRGLYFYSQSKVALDMLELGTDEIIRLITEAKLSGSYSYIILDLDFGIDKDVMRLPYSTVLFDLDDTLFDFRAAEAAAIRQVLKNNNLPSEEEAVKTYSDINLRYWHLFESGEISREQIFTGRFVTLLNTFGINGDEKDRSRMLLVGDSQSSDILGGINAGIDTCWFNPSGKQFYTLLADL